MVLLSKWDPFSEFDELQKQFLGSSFAHSDTGVPALDVYSDSDKQIVVEAHLPNFSKDDVEVDVHEGALEIRAEKKGKEEKKEKRKYVLKESASSMYRRVLLPKNVNESKVEAHFEDGVLKVTVPLKQLPKPKKIDIKSKQK